MFFKRLFKKIKKNSKSPERIKKSPSMLIVYSTPSCASQSISMRVLANLIAYFIKILTISCLNG